MSEEFKVKPVEQRPRIMIATPMYGGMCTGAYVQGLLFTIRRMQEAGVDVYWCQITNESLITRARNELTRVFLDQGHDYFMFIDADIGFDGSLDTSIAIRTVLMDGRRAVLQAGGGITLLSDPQAEYRETLTKAERIFAAFASGDPT